MSRSGYHDDIDDPWQHIRWRGMVASALRGMRGQLFLLEMLTALDALPLKRLVANELEVGEPIACSHWGLFEASSVCAIGAVGRRRGLDMADIDPEDPPQVAGAFGIAEPMAKEIVYMNDEWGSSRETPEKRFQRMRTWIVSQIRDFEVATDSPRSSRPTIEG
jgi:hypothetical protein